MARLVQVTLILLSHLKPQRFQSDMTSYFFEGHGSCPASEIYVPGNGRPVMFWSVKGLRQQFWPGQKGNEYISLTAQTVVRMHAKRYCDCWLGSNEVDGVASRHLCTQNIRISQVYITKYINIHKHSIYIRYPTQ